MLVSLYLENFVIIDRLRIEPSPGLTVLSGETGAGKSIIVEAVGLLLGDRAAADYVRAGAERAVVEGYFQCQAQDPAVEACNELGITLEDGNVILLSREIASSGRSTCRINGRIVTLGIYQQVARNLVDIHGQHEQQSLFSPQRQLLLLDIMGGAELMAARQQVYEAYHRQKTLTEQLESWKETAASRQREMELVAAWVEEIARAGLGPGEKESLEQERQVLREMDKLLGRVQTVLTSLQGDGTLPGACDQLAGAVAGLEEAARIDAGLAGLVGQLREALYEAQDVAQQLQRQAQDMVFDPQRLEQVEERLDGIRRLERKHGRELDGILQWAREAAGQLETWQTEIAGQQELEEEIQKARSRYHGAVTTLTTLRDETAGRLELAVREALADLGMQEAQFLVLKKPRPGFHPLGNEEIEFMLAANVGEPPRPLAKVVSGGEISRVMLALKACLAEVDNIPTLIFDEIEAGVGGQTVQAVAAKLSQLSRAHQVLCVTHSPHIASLAEQHFTVSKHVSGERTLAQVQLLQGEERIREVARMLSGAETQVSLQHAEELLRRAETDGEG